MAVARYIDGGFSTASATIATALGGSDRLLIAMCAPYLVTGAPTVDTMTFGGVSMTKFHDAAFATSSHARLTLWYLIAPATGTDVLAATFSATPFAQQIIWLQVTGASQSAAPTIGESATGTGTYSVSVAGADPYVALWHAEAQTLPASWASGSESDTTTARITLSFAAIMAKMWTVETASTDPYTATITKSGGLASQGRAHAGVRIAAAAAVVPSFVNVN